MQAALAGCRTTCAHGQALQQQQQQQPVGFRQAAFRPGNWRAVSQRRPLLCRAQAEQEGGAAKTGDAPPPPSTDLDKDISKFARNAATTFAPRASGATGKNPAYKGSVLYSIFEVQAWVAVVVGGLLSFNVIFPSNEPDIARLMGMWSIWAFTVPALRARECTDREKDALNLLFIAIPLLNVALPFVIKSFPVIFSADCVLMAGVYAWKGLLPGIGGTSEEQKS